MLDTAEKEPSGAANSSYLPDFCTGDAFLRLLLVIELIAIVFALVSFNRGSFTIHLGMISVVMLWVGLTSGAILCLLRRRGWLDNHLHASVIAISITLVMTLLASFISLSLGAVVNFGPTAQNAGYTLARNLAVAAILVGLALRYFYLHYESDQRLKVQARARLQALQARIRPHFLFNSMNTIASLTHDEPDLAEQSIENLADLFRASLAAESSIALEQELTLTRSYIELESLRLGERLQVDWHLPEPTPKLNLPALTLQPLVENAIYHGIEPLPSGGTIEIRIEPGDRQLDISISNPVGPTQQGRQREGNRMALENIRERLDLAFGGNAGMTLNESESSYTVVLTIPQREVE